MRIILDIFDRVSSSSMPRITQTDIVCGDCAGDELLPRKTKLTTAGRCADCGGRNYELASVIGAKLAQFLRKSKEKKEKYAKHLNAETTGNCIEIGGNLPN